MSNSHDEIFDTLCKLSDRRLDDRVKPRLQALKGRKGDEIKDELLGIIDDMAYASFSSNFEIEVLRVIWFECGGSTGELMDRAEVLREGNPEEVKKLKEKHKWQACHI